MAIAVMFWLHLKELEEGMQKATSSMDAHVIPAPPHESQGYLRQMDLETF